MLRCFPLQEDAEKTSGIGYNLAGILVGKHPRTSLLPQVKRSVDELIFCRYHLLVLDN